MTGHEFGDLLEALGYDFFAGVPCSLIEGVLRRLEAHPRLPYIPAVREDVAVGLAAGAWLGGRRPAVLMQNSGLGTGLNALASLSLLYRLPCLLVVTWRGYGGADAPEHLLTGEITPRLLELLGIRYRVLNSASTQADLQWATGEADRRMEPVAVLVPPGLFGPAGTDHAGAAGHAEMAGHEGASDPEQTAGAAWGSGGDAGRSGAPVGRPAAGAAETGRAAPLAPALSRLDALRATVAVLGDEPVIHANGFVCRESFAVADRPANFYMIGSMGLASAIGLGLALARPDLTPVVFDGDGNLLMSLGVLPLVGALAPANFVHVVFDNEAYGSTGNQRSVSGAVRLDRLAAAAGYRTAAAADAGAIREAVGSALARPGPHFVLVKVTCDEAPVPRIPYPPEAIRDRFRSAIGARRPSLRADVPGRSVRPA